MFLDVGANAGMSALSFRVFDRWRPIVSVEPNPSHRADLRFAQALARRMRFHILAAGAEEGTLTLYVPVYRGVALTTEASVHRESVAHSPSLRERLGERMDAREFSIEEHRVETLPLDALSLQAAFVKIDVQGAETEVVTGLRETISSFRPVMLIEAPTHEVYELLAGLGYRPFTYDRDAHRVRPQTESQVNTVFLHERDWPPGT